MRACVWGGRQVEALSAPQQNTDVLMAHASGCKQSFGQAAYTPEVRRGQHACDSTMAKPAQGLQKGVGCGMHSIIPTTTTPGWISSACSHTQQQQQQQPGRLGQLIPSPRQGGAATL